MNTTGAFQIMCVFVSYKTFKRFFFFFIMDSLIFWPLRHLLCSHLMTFPAFTEYNI